MGGRRLGMTNGLMLIGTVALLALPSAVLAFAARFAMPAMVAGGSKAIAPFRSDAVGPSLARGFSLRLAPREPLYPFTPAKNPNRPDRSVTVAVRLDSQALRTITVLAKGAPDPGAASANLRLQQSGFNLGIARGYRNFSSDPVAAGAVRKGDAPDLSHVSVATAGDDQPSRFSPRVQFGDRMAPGRAPRTFAGDREEQVDLGGRYRLGRNLDVTAGVRYSAQDRERLRPLTDGKQDSQAVYVGTQLHF